MISKEKFWLTDHQKQFNDLPDILQEYAATPLYGGIQCNSNEGHINYMLNGPKAPQSFINLMTMYGDAYVKLQKEKENDI